MAETPPPQPVQTPKLPPEKSSQAPTIGRIVIVTIPHYSKLVPAIIAGVNDDGSLDVHAFVPKEAHSLSILGVVENTKNDPSDKPTWSWPKIEPATKPA